MNQNKTIRTLFALFCVLVMTFALAATAFADGDPIAVVSCPMGGGSGFC